MYFLGFLPSGSEWIIIVLVIIPICVCLVRLLDAIIHYLNRK